MPLTDCEYVITRLQDYWGRRTPWQRRLWNLGTVALLQEVLEASAMHREGQFHERTVTDLAASARKQVGRDLGMGPGPVRTEIQNALSVVNKDSAATRRLELLSADRSPSYLDEWRVAWSGAGPAPGTEFTSRLLGAHLLDCGFSPDHLHRWVTAVASGRRGMSVPDLIDEARQLESRTSRTYEVLIPVRSIPRHQQPMPSTWLESPAAAQWIRDHGPGGGSGIRQNGAFLLEVVARDPWRAVEIASDTVQRIAARVVVGLPGQDELLIHDEAAVRDSRRTYPMRRPRRQVEVHALSRNGVLFETSPAAMSDRIRSALDLLGPLESGTPESAVSGGWAAVEALLKRQDASSVQVADELAALVACSLPRAELTTLAYAYVAEHNDGLSKQLKLCTSNRDRCNLLGQAIIGGSVATFGSPSDSTALARVSEILVHPAEVLHTVRGYASEVFRRLYRQRNLVLHAGRSDSVAMLSTLRCAPPLVGAAVDRIVHAALQQPPVDPQNLVARAEVSIRLGSDTGRTVADLLE
jgi:hypothetical protein